MTPESRKLKRFHSYLRGTWAPGVRICGMLYDPPKVLKKIAPMAYASAYAFWQTSMCHSCNKVEKSLRSFAGMNLCDLCHKRFNDAAVSSAELKSSL